MATNFSNHDEQQTALIIRMAQLIARMQLGELSNAEQEELNAWLAADERNRAWKEQLSNEAYVSGLSEQYRLLEANVEASLQAFRSKHLLVVIKRNTNRWWAVAAVLIPLIAASLWLMNSHQRQPTNVAANIPPGRNTATLILANGSQVALDTNRSGRLSQNGGVTIVYKQGQINYQQGDPTIKEVNYNTLTTPKGGQFELRLPDGTRVWLNAASSIRYPTAFNGNERQVTLTGEAYFEVAKKINQPFSVSVNGMNVQVLGTEFDIMAYPEEGDKKTTLVQGAVKIQSGNAAQQIKPGQQAIVSTKGDLSVTSQVDVESVVAWKLGFFQFRDMDLQTIMREISRWYDVDVVYQRRDLSGKYGGRISRNLSLSELVQLLEGNGLGDFRLEGRKLIVL